MSASLRLPCLISCNSFLACHQQANLSCYLEKNLSWEAKRERDWLSWFFLSRNNHIYEKLTDNSFCEWVGRMPAFEVVLTNFCQYFILPSEVYFWNSIIWNSMGHCVKYEISKTHKRQITQNLTYRWNLTIEAESRTVPGAGNSEVKMVQTFRQDEWDLLYIAWWLSLIITYISKLLKHQIL